MLFYITFLMFMSITNADPIDPVYQADQGPIVHRRHGFVSDNFQSSAGPFYTSEVEAAIKAHTAAYQATRARDLAQHNYKNPKVTSFDSVLKIYDSTKGIDGIVSNVKVYGNRLAKITSDTTLVEHGFFPKSAPIFYYKPNGATVKILEKASENPNFVLPPSPLSSNVINSNPQELFQGVQPAFVLPPPLPPHYVKVGPLGKLFYRTLDVDVRTPHGPWKKV